MNKILFSVSYFVCNGDVNVAKLGIEIFNKKLARGVHC
jgi:hypothetical protein